MFWNMIDMNLIYNISHQKYYKQYYANELGCVDFKKQI